MGRLIAFPPFRVDAANEVLWRERDAVPLRPKSFALLRYLAERPGQLVTKDELLDALWPETHVSDVVLKVCVNELRHALGDTARAPRFIATVYRRGYRFVAEQATPEDAASSRPAGAPAAILVGRDGERDRLAQCFAQAMLGRRQVVFVGGEAGIGKTTLVDAFLERTVPPAGTPPWISRGQCVAQYGAAEPFLPVLEGLGRLCRGPDGGPLVALLRDLAPEWLLQLPGVLGSGERQQLQRRLGTPSPDRMLRIMADALEALTARRPLVVVLEDLHWSDHATIDLLAHVAGRPDAARLMVLGTYRPAEAIVHAHPVRALAGDLQTRRRGQELGLGLLTPPAMTAYLEARFPGAALPGGLAAWLHGRTDGNPLFMASVIDELAAQGLIVDVDGRATPQAGFERVGIPESLRLMIEQQIERLSADEQTVLDAASVVGAEFSAASVAAALAADVAQIEDRCVALAHRSQMLRPLGRGEWPDGTVAGRYAFAHSVHREELYGRIPAGRRAELHRRVAERLVAAYGEETSEVTAELAMRFEEAGDRRRAIGALRQVAERAVGAGAHRDALGSLSHAFELLAGVPEGRERDQVALALQHARGAALIGVRGFAHQEVRDTYEQAFALSTRLGDETTTLVALAGRWSFHFFRREPRPMLEIAEQLVDLAGSTPGPPLVLLAHTLMGVTRAIQGELGTAREHLERALATDEDSRPFLFVDLRTTALSCLSVVLVLLGHPDHAREREAQALERARAAARPFELGLVLVYACELGCLLGDAARVERLTAEAEPLAAVHGFPLWLAIFRFARGWARAVRDGGDADVAAMEQELQEYRRLGSEAGAPFLLGVLADALLRSGRPQAAGERLREAQVLAEHTGEGRDLAELSRLEGECLLHRDGRGHGRGKTRPSPAIVAQAERCLRRAVEHAHAQGARWFELRALTSLGRLGFPGARGAEVRDALAGLLERVGEGADTPTVRDARAVLARR